MLNDDTTTEIGIADLAAQFMKEHRQGGRPSIADYAHAHPAMADAIRELFPGLIMLEGMAKDNRQAPRYSLLSGVKRPDVLGDYRILQEIGAGGMGVVYEAEQISLARHVALKVLPFQMVGDQRAIDRFQREARAAACLVHENIVPVYDVGEDDSVWYYAMQFIHGQSLHEVRVHLQQLSCKGGQLTDAQQMGQLSELARGLFDGKGQEETQSQHGPEPPEAEHGHTTVPDVGAADQPDQDDRTVELREVIDECLRRRAGGEDLPDEVVIAAHPRLMPELRDELRMLKLLEASRPPEIVNDLIQLDAKLRPAASTNGKSSPGSDQTTANAQTVSVTELLASAHDSESHLRTYFLNLALLIADVADALDYAHHRGIVHRDIKPSNLLLDTRGRIWVTDFGLARIAHAEATTSGKMAGTLRYMSPEQVKGKCDARSDVYSLGITLYEMATLQQAIEGENFVDTIQLICHEGPTPPRQVETRVPRDLERIVLKAIARNPEDRYQSANEFAADLRRFVNGESVMAQQAGLWGRGLRRCRRNLVVAAALAMAIVAWVMMIYMFVVMQRQNTLLQQLQTQTSQAIVQPTLESDTFANPFRPRQ